MCTCRCRFFERTSVTVVKAAENPWNPPLWYAFSRKSASASDGALSGRGSIFLGPRRLLALRLSGNDWQLIYDAGQGSWSFWSYQRSGRRACNANSRGDRRKAPADTALTRGKPLLVTVPPFHPFVTLWHLSLCLTAFAVPHRCFYLETGVVSASSNLCLSSFLEIIKNELFYLYIS